MSRNQRAPSGCCGSRDSIPPGLDVNLFGREYFVHEHPCSKELYNHVLGGEGLDGNGFDWRYDVSFEMMLKYCDIEADLAEKYPRLSSFQLLSNWLVVVLGMVCFLVPGLYYLVILAQSGDKTDAAAMLMAKRAYDLERVDRQTAGPEKDRLDDVIVHHLICAYYQEYCDISNKNNPFTTFFAFRKLSFVDAYISDTIQPYLQKYSMVGSTKLKFAERVRAKASAALSRPMHGRTRGMMALAAVLFTVYVLLLVGMSYTGNRVLIVIGSVLLTIDVILTILYLGSWVPVTRRVAGLTRDTFQRWENGRISSDEIGAVTDLALLAIRCSEAECREEGRVSEHWWISLLHASEKPKSSTRSQKLVEVSIGMNNSSKLGVTSDRSANASSEGIQAPQGQQPSAHLNLRQVAPVGYPLHGYGPRMAPQHVPMHPTQHAPPVMYPAAPPMARNAEDMGYTGSQMEAFQMGVMKGRQQQSAYLYPNQPNVQPLT